MTNSTIKSWAEDDRPREKMMLKGSEALSNAELLAILINNGTRDRSAVDVCKDLLNAVGNDLNRLGRLSIKEILKLKTKGIGEAKAISIAAALELGIRRDAAEKRRDTITHSRDVAAFLKAKLQYKKHEVFAVLFLNQANKVMHYEVLSEGGITGTVADPRIILKKALAHDAVKFWNEPNNKSHWAFEIDPEWRIFGEMVKVAAEAVKAENPGITRVLGGISPIDPHFIKVLKSYGTLDNLDAVAVHGFPFDWNNWSINEWPNKIAEIEAVTDLPVWVTEVGISTFGAEEVQEFGLRRTAELLSGRVDRVHWYSLYDLPKTWEATTRHREAEGSSYYRHFYLGLLKEDGTPKLASKIFSDYTPEFGICQWFHFEDHRLDCAVEWLHRLGVKKLRTGLSWADWLRPDAEKWFDRVMKAIDEFDVTATFCFTPESKGIQPHHTSPPQNINEFADFCVEMMRRYA